MNEAEQYIKTKRLVTYNSISNCKRIYLDTNFWIRLRDAQGDPNSRDSALLQRITELVESNRCILPISETTFWEVLKQNDLNSLRKSAYIIDKLSKGISIISERERSTLEFLHFMMNARKKNCYDTSELVWTKLSMNILYPVLPHPEDLEIKKSFIDQLCAMSFSDIITKLEKSQYYKPFTFQDDVDFLNAAKEKYKNENKSIDQMFLSELGGYVHLFKGSLNEAMDQLFFWESGRYPTVEEKLSIDQDNLTNMVYNLFKFKKAKTEFPTYSIFPDLFATVRWNKTRKYSDGNDTMDFLHASTALPYFDFFFTERELNSIIKQRKLDVTFNCVVESDPKKVLEQLKSI